MSKGQAEETSPIFIRTPLGFRPECEWVISGIFRKIFELPLLVTADESQNFIIYQANRSLSLPDVFFSSAANLWFSPKTLPQLPLLEWNLATSNLVVQLAENVIPILYGKTGFVIDESGNGHLGLDVFGSAFFMLSRYEEAVLTERDEHDRFPATASIAYKAGFLNRPIIDEYVEILWAAMKRVWPRLQRKPRTRTLRVTCDVDSHCQVEYSTHAMLRCFAGDVLKRCSPGLAMSNLHTRWRARQGDFAGDPHWNSIDWIMDENERAGNRVAFYFITDRSHPTCDAHYRMNEPGIRMLLRRIHARGHEIGLHPSYNTYQNPGQTAWEADILRRTLEEENIPCAELGGRQHYLRWQTPITARNLEAAGIAYDSTLSYADRPGFRCGTSREFTMYDVIERRPLALKQRPLVLMECSVIAEQYLGLGYTDEALALMLELKDRSLAIGGEFTLLWHNSHFNKPEDRVFYRELVKN